MVGTPGCVVFLALAGSVLSAVWVLREVQSQAAAAAAAAAAVAKATASLLQTGTGRVPGRCCSTSAPQQQRTAKLTQPGPRLPHGGFN